ncbi:MAG: 2-oxoacid:acceptor oxidoreductase subunit alpha [Acidobacteriota bacterium]
MTRALTIGMAGAGGDGIVSAGESLINAAAIEGYYAILTKSFGSQIRGGESSCRLRMSPEPIHNTGGLLDVAVALSWEDFLKFGAELPVGGSTTVILDEACGVDPAQLPIGGVRPAEVLVVPVSRMSRQSAGSEKAKNSVVLGLLAGWLGLGEAAIIGGLERKLARKGTEVVEAARRAFAIGLEHARKAPLARGQRMPPPSSNGKRLLVDGNDLCAAAALFAGCDFFGGYPITPSSEIMQFLDRELWKHGGTVLQAEDEIAGIGAAVGASFAGKKAMTATSGPGMSLKTEILGLATIAELPLVCVNVQRGGPSTGLPTKSEQADLLQAAFSAHGDVVRPVIAPASVADVFALTVEAFNIAEELQTPVILLSDQDISQRKEVIDAIDTSVFRLKERRAPTPGELERYDRFRLTDSCVSPLSHPGLAGGNYLASGIEHGEHGAPSSSGSVHAQMNEKRFRKIDPLKLRRDLFDVLGEAGAPLGLVAGGRVAGVAREAVEMAAAEGLRAKLLVPKLLYPVAEDVYVEFFGSLRRGLVVEQSHQGQLYRLLRMFVDVPRGVVPCCRSGANPFTPLEILERLRSLALDLQRSMAPEPEPAE